ncbi:hypothetical protein ACFSTC_26165 [Nonomuraea ferruginea]
MAEAAAELVLEVADRAADPGFVPEPPVPGGPVVRVREPGGVLSWEAPTEEVVRRVRAADGEPGGGGGVVRAGGAGVRRVPGGQCWGCAGCGGGAAGGCGAGAHR